MGFLYLGIKFPKAITITFFLTMFDHARLFLIGVLAYLCLYKPPPEEEPISTNNSNNYILILDGSSPSLIFVLVQVVTTAIKNRVPIIQYHDFLLRNKQAKEEEGLCGQKVCSICFECIERSYAIREPWNCSHLFHRECLDTWIDEGQVTCPLCRSMLLPPRINLFRCNDNQQGGMSIERSHEIREPSHCSHLFHRECLDIWIDEGQVTCPLCRFMLLPPRINLFRCNENQQGGMSIERSHAIREPSNCSHLFHRECLDTWIDEGQVTCPLCRSMLLPPRINLFRCSENQQGLVQSNTHFVDA